MAIQIDKNPPESKNFTEHIVDFSGGLNTTISGSLLNSNEAQIANNISMEQKGTIRPRRGRIKRYTSPFIASPITGIGVYYKRDGTSRLLMSAGDSIFSDTSHMSTKWTVKSEWEQTGVTFDGFASSTEKEGSVTTRKQPMGIAAKCEDVLLWTPLDATLSLSTNNSPYHGGSAIEVLINTGRTIGFAFRTPTIDTTRHAVLTGYVRNVNATNGIRIIGLTSGNVVSRSSSAVTATGWTRLILKLTPTELLNISRFGVNVTGTAGQRAFFTGLYFKYITAAEHADAGYIPPELTHYEVFQRQISYNNAITFNTGTHSQTTVAADRLALAIEISTSTTLFTDRAHFDTGVYNNTSGSEIVDSVVLARQL